MTRTPACSSERIVETYRDHTSSCARFGAFEAIVILYMLGIVSAAVAFNMGWI